ncbi:tRNA-binding protein [Salegentibacter sp. 24]|jgi:tRNA-binding protein|uniref:tRNA-binding protein n=1 Tax=Salegentibacter sp. 24 TaxID=2183986 RepID=UPI00105CB249|nr:tRNA-binding protein [Salegentibacter sp. 24]TDN84729.1 tRNA-binding protein [Salegentibacter sp. 24]
MEISWKDFEKVDMRIGTITEVSDFPEAKKPAYKMVIDFGEEIGQRKTSAQITKRYNKQALLNRQIVAVVNFPKKQIANIMSECLILGALGNENDIVLLNPASRVKNGLRVG